MTQLKIENGIFYVLETNDTKSLFDTQESAISELKTQIESNKELNADNVSIMEVNTSDETWKLQSLSWASISMGLIRGA